MTRVDRPADAAQLEAEKRALRALMRARRAALSSEQRVAATHAACARLAELPAFASATVVAGFAPIHDEIDPAAALATVTARGGQVVWPRVSGQVPRLRYHRVDDPSQLQPGAFGILEPLVSCPEVPASAIDCVLAPGLAFDQRGARLGYGGGFFDELARFAVRAVLIGFAYDLQIVDRCPAGAGDVAMHVVVTDGRVAAARNP